MGYGSDETCVTQKQVGLLVLNLPSLIQVDGLQLRTNFLSVSLIIVNLIRPRCCDLLLFI